MRLGSIRLGFNRTAAAAILTVVAVALPSGAWYLAGSRQIEREVHLKHKIVQDRATKKAVVLAERLATRLEVLRESESRRAFYHYQNLYHDPKGAAEGRSVSISPLAQGPADPLIEAHFQVDERGELSLPTLNDAFPELGLRLPGHDQCALLDQLEQVAIFCRRDLGELQSPAYPPRSGPAFAVDGDDLHQPIDCFGGDVASPERQIEELPAAAWRQHLRASELYADLKYGSRNGRGNAALEIAALGQGGGEGRVEIAVGPLEWRTLELGGRSKLIALRPVETPRGLWAQGFLVSVEAVEIYLRDSPYPADFAPGREFPRERDSGQVVMAVQGTPWVIALDISQTLARAAMESRGEGQRFLRLFLICLGAAGLAGLVVVAMVRQSERLAQQRAQFAASAAHELRTPIAGLRLYSEMLAEGLGEPARSKVYARRLAGEAERLGRVVTNVLSFTHLERKTLSVDPQEGDLVEAVEEAVLRLAPALEEAGARLELEIPEDLGPVRFDRDATAQILQNLLDNAEKYSRGIDDRRVLVRLAAEPGEVRLEVEDNGPGVPRGERGRLFRPFERGAAGDEEPAGLGLGLVLVKALAEAQGGRVSYHDAPAGGAIFRIALPA